MVISMGNRAIYVITEDKKSTSFYTHWGGNALSPLWRLLQAKELQGQIPEKKSIAHIFEHLDDQGQYVNPPHDNPADMFCSRTDDVVITQGTFDLQGVEMLVQLDLDSNTCLLEYNRSYPWYAHMDSHSIPIDVGLGNVEKLLQAAERSGIDSFGQLLMIYNKATGLDEALENARAGQRLDEYLNSEEAEADRECYRTYYGSPDEPEDDNELEV